MGMMPSGSPPTLDINAGKGFCVVHHAFEAFQHVFVPLVFWQPSPPGAVWRSMAVEVNSIEGVFL